MVTDVAGLNADLVRLLLDRDELYMQQDSFLVDVDDLNRFVIKYYSSLPFEQIGFCFVSLSYFSVFFVRCGKLRWLAVGFPTHVEYSSVVSYMYRPLLLDLKFLSLSELFRMLSERPNWQKSLKFVKPLAGHV